MKFDINGMMRQVQKMQKEMEKVQEELGNKVVTEESGGGMVKVTVTGKQNIVKIEIDPEVINKDDKEMLEDLIIAAVNKGIESSKKMAEEEMNKITKGMLPPGMGFPGF